MTAMFQLDYVPNRMFNLFLFFFVNEVQFSRYIKP